MFHASIVLYKTPFDEVDRCIKSLQACRHKNIITIICNDRSASNYRDIFDDNISFIDSDNVGYGNAHNIALLNDRVSCRYNLVINSDLFFSGDQIDALIDYMELNPDVGLVSPKVTYRDGTIQNLCRLMPSPLMVFGRAFLPFVPYFKRLDDEYQFAQWSYAQIGNFPYLSGCFMLIRRSVIDNIGGFDKRFFMFFEDVDFSRRIHSRYKTIFFPDVVIQHEYRSKKALNLKLSRYKAVSAVRYFCKWGWFFDKKRMQMNHIAKNQFKLKNG